MTIDQLPEEQCRAVLQRATMGRLGCAVDNQPYVVPVYFAYEGDYLYFFSTVGQKIEWMRQNPKVCLQVDEITKQAEWTSVVVSGLYEELPDPQLAAERNHARTLLARRHQWWLNAVAERRMNASDESVGPIFFRIHVETVTGIAAMQDTERRPLAG